MATEHARKRFHARFRLGVALGLVLGFSIGYTTNAVLRNNDRDELAGRPPHGTCYGLSDQTR